MSGLKFLLILLLLIKKKAEAAINLTYESMEEGKPKEIVWFDNPLDAAIWIIDNLNYLEQLKDVPDTNYKTGTFSVVSHQITWEDELIDYLVNLRCDKLINHCFLA